VVEGAAVNTAHRAAAAALMTGTQRAVWLGALATRHPAYADLRAIAAALADLTQASLGVLLEGGNAVGAYLAGAVPHRSAGGRAVAPAGKTAREMLSKPQKAYLLVGGVEPSSDALLADSAAALRGATNVVAITPYRSAELDAIATVLLPCGTYVESSGTYVNLEGTWQSFAGAAKPLGEARPAWKVLRVLGNMVGAAGFDYQSSEQVRDAVRAHCGSALGTRYTGAHVASAVAGDIRVVDVPMYDIDAIVRRSPSLHRTTEALRAPQIYAGVER
jgi:NADH-quinone oxidoreductase subunit G